MKRFISVILVFMMVLGMMPVGEIVAFAGDDKATVKKIIVNKTYESIEDYGTFFISIIGENLDKAEVKIIESGGVLKDPIKSPESGDYIVQYSYPSSSIGQRLFIDGAEYSLGEEDIPRITGRGGSTTNIVDANGTVTLTGEKIKNLEEVVTEAGKPDRKLIEAYFSQSSSKEPIQVDGNDKDIEDDGDKKKIVKNVGTVLGSHSLVFQKKTTENSVPLEIEHTYKSIIVVRGELKVEGNVSMFPSQGPTDSLVTVTADKIESNISVFFMKKGEQYKYTKENMALNETVKHIQENGKEKIEFRVLQGLKNGLHEVVFTNKVDPNKNIDNQISKYKIIGNGTGVNLKTLDFNVVDGTSGVDLKKITPNFSSINGIPAIIEGRNIIRISPNLYEGANITGVDITDNKKMIVSFQGGKYNGEPVKSIKRTITVQIGTNATFTGHKKDGDVYDYLDIVVPQNDDLNIPIKDVIVFITNEIKFVDITKEDATITEGDTIENGFTYNPIDYEPKITNILPKIIPVDESGKVTEDFIISITGENFLKYGYMKDKTLTSKMPKISVDKQGQSPSWFDNDNIRMYDKNGKLLEEKEGEQFGSIIKVKIKKGSEIPDTIVPSTQKLKLQNPLAIESDGDMGSYTTGEIQFVEVGSEKTPIITEVTPSTVTTDGEKGVTIKGANFGTNVSVYLDGEKLTGIQRNGTGTEIIFDAPKNLEGEYQIIVQNEEGGLATFDEFIYVKTYTNIKLTDFAPKKGSANTLVSIKGESFVPMDPLVRDLTGAGIYKLVGTRVLLGGVDVNSYNEKDGKPILKEFKPKKAILKNSDGVLETEDYHDSVVLKGKDESGKDKYYKIYKNARTGKIMLTDGNKEVFELAVKNDIIYARKINVVDGKPVGTDRKIELDDPSKVEVEAKDGDSAINLTIHTLYLTNKDNYEIIGNNSKVLNDGEITFKVPPKAKEGYYDLTVINPDNKKDSKVGNSGFWYFFQPQSNPKIETIEPNQGSTQGDYFITIVGEDFKNTPTGKTSVIIGGITVDPKDIEVSTDGKIIRFKVPKYPGDLNKETDTGRKTVPVVVLNPDGASENEEDGFTYVIPISNPKITALVLNKGTAAGGETISVEGDDFRFFEPFRDLNNNRKWDDKGESDTDGDGVITTNDPAEPFDDLNKDEKWTDLKGKKVSELSLADKEILPTIYFGNQAVEILSFTEGSIEVKTPKGAKGSVDVYLVNNDFGVSNKVKFAYEASTPKINSIVPNVGRKQGKDKVEILGESFYKSKVKVINSKNSTKEQDLQLIQFGDLKDVNISNRDVKIDAQLNSGRIKNGLATVKVGNLTVKYDATGDKKKLDFTLEDKQDKVDAKYVLDFTGYDDGEIFLPVWLLKDGNGKSPSASHEYVKINLETIAGANATKKLRIDRGFSPEATTINAGHITLETPSYYTVGKTKVTIINPDGSTAEDDFEYKNPDSNPKITNILRDTQEGKLEQYVDNNGAAKTREIVRVNVSGGNTIDIIGTDFRKPVKIKVGDIPEITTGIEYDPDESISQKMTFKMLKVDEKYVGTRHRVVIENEDGGTAGSDQSTPPIYIEFIKGETTGLTITGVTPSAGPTTGGTRVTISGKDFRKTMEGFEGETLKVYFGDGKDKALVPDANIESVSIDKIVLKTPPHAAGKVTITVENPDGSITELKDAYTYISNPKITNIVDPENGDAKKESLSIEGGETIKIVGNDFMEGAKVIFNPVLKKVSEYPDAKGDKIFIDGTEYILESKTEGTDVEFINSGSLKVKTPAGKLDTGGVIVINPDGAATPIYGLKYTIPEISYPRDVRASLIKDEYIRINWDAVIDKATQDDGKTVQYEVYVIEGNSRQFIGSTGTTGFVFRDIKSRTTYKFLVRSIGKYGSSKPISESMSNEVRTGSVAGPVDNDGELGEKTKVEKTGNTANVVIGEDAFDQGSEYIIDTTRGTLSGSNEVAISISAKTVINEKNKKIKIIGKDYTLGFSLSVFENSKLRSNTSKDDAGVRFKISSVNPSFDLKSNSGDTIIAAKYLLDGKVFVGSSQDNIENLDGKMNFVLDYDTNIVETRRMKTINLVRYDDYDRKFEKILSNSQYGTSTADISKLGTYTITGSRR